MTVPVRLAAVIRNESDWKSYIVFSNVNQKIEGYFVLVNDITLGNVKTDVKPAVVNSLSVGFCGVFDGNGKTITVPKGANTGLGIFGSIGDGAKIGNLIITDDSETSPGWKSNTLLALVATNAEIYGTIININGANHTSGARYGALTHEGIASCVLKRVTINIDGKVQSLAGGGINEKLGLAGTNFNSCIIKLLNADSALDEVGHIGEAVYVAKGASIADGEKTLDGIIIGGTKTTDYLFENSTSEYSVVIPQGASATIEKAAAPAMKEYFNNWKTIFNQKMSAYSLGYDGKIGANFTYDDISRDLLDVLDKAYAAIEEYKTSDAELYATVKRRIDLEWLCPAKIALTAYEPMRKSQPTRFSDIRTKFLGIVEETGISAASEFKDIQSLIDEINSITI